MAAELVAAVLIGLLAIGTLLAPLIWPPRPRTLSDDAAEGYIEFEETARGQALLALKEIDFDRATGKLSERDYDELRAKYTARAVALLDAEAPTGAGDDAMRAAPVPTCPDCGPRPEPDAFICSTCGRMLPAVVACPACQAQLPAASRFCDRCGAATPGQVPASA